MEKINSVEKKIGTILVLILAGEAIFFLPFVLARIFRPTLLIVFDMSNLQLGSLFSVYGIIAMISYLFGGPLADRFQARNLIAIALWTTSLGGFVMATVPDQAGMLWLYAFWGITSIFLFWAALIKATRIWGGNEQGKAFGFLEGGRGLMAAVLGSIVVLVFSSSSDVTSDESSRIESFQIVIIATTLITFVAGCLSWVFIPKSENAEGSGIQIVSIREFVDSLKNPLLLQLVVIVLCAYIGYKVTDNISLYSFEVLHMDEIEASKMASFALWMRPIFALLAGFLADRFKSYNVLIGCFSFMLFGGLMLSMSLLGEVWLIVIIISTTVAGVYGLRGIYFAIMNEAKISLSSTGLSVGIISCIGLSPDIFMSPFMGFLLDEYSGQIGHQLIFATLTIFSLIGLVVSYRFKQNVIG
ncbi:MAG: MFS transporter [Reichenbachiella sp.]